jgi:hypothetical protein
MVHGPADGLHGLAEDGPSDVFFVLSYFYLVLFLYFYILLRRRLALRLTS